jgi:hypothetical protein
LPLQIQHDCNLTFGLATGDEKTSPVWNFVAGEAALGRVMPLDVLSFKSLVARDDVEGDFLAFEQGFETAAHDGRMMYENVLTGRLSDETEAFFVVEPLYFATSHSFSPEPRGARQ